jgi:hypothetical protein
MATFTRIPEGDTPSIDVDPARRLSKINKNIYGGFMEYVSYCTSPVIPSPISLLLTSLAVFLRVWKDLQCIFPST